MFRLFINKQKVETEVKSIAEKVSICKEKFSELMYNRICLKNEELTQEDIALMQKEVLELYDLIMNSPSKIRKYAIFEIFQFEIKLEYFTLDKLLDQIKGTVIVTLVKEGRLKI